VTYTLVPWLVQIEQAISRDLFKISEGKRSHFAEHLVDGLLRGDVQSRNMAYNTAHMGGWMSADEIRERENLNPIRMVREILLDAAQHANGGAGA